MAINRANSAQKLIEAKLPPITRLEDSGRAVNADLPPGNFLPSSLYGVQPCEKRTNSLPLLTSVWLLSSLRHGGWNGGIDLEFAVTSGWEPLIYRTGGRKELVLPECQGVERQLCDFDEG